MERIELQNREKNEIKISERISTRILQIVPSWK
jgi:hypothetical protein